MTEKQTNLYRKKALDRISSPDQLTDYLRVTSPGVWVVLAAVILLLAGILAWSAVGTLETTADVRVVVEDQAAHVLPLGGETLAEGMTLRVDGRDYLLDSVTADDYGRSLAEARVSLPDGTYSGRVVIETVHPIEFLLTSR